MLTFFDGQRSATCEGASRRDFLRIGALGAAGLGLPGLLRQRAAQANAGQTTSQWKSVVWLWLGGGPTHIETFDPKMSAPAEFRSMNGALDTRLPGVQFGGMFPRLAQQADRLAVLRSFAHSNSGHGGGTHYVMTGYDYPQADQGAPAVKPSLGAIAARLRGPNHPATGIPTYVRTDATYADGAAWLGAAYGPFDSGGQAKNNMQMAIDAPRLDDRRDLLRRLDRINRYVDRSGLMEGLDSFEGQAFQLIQSSAKEAFDLTPESPATRELYGPGLGDKLLLARRLCEAGCGFVSMHFGGWDLHGGMIPGMQSLGPQVDKAVGAFVEDTVARGLDEQILLVITGEFGRTPRINGSAGRDHWAPLSTLALAGGGLRMGQVVGESSEKAEVPKSTPIGPQDLMATVFHVLGLPADAHFNDPAGRPTTMLTSGRVIQELV